MTKLPGVTARLLSALMVTSVLLAGCGDDSSVKTGDEGPSQAKLDRLSAQTLAEDPTVSNNAAATLVRLCEEDGSLLPVLRRARDDLWDVASPFDGDPRWTASLKLSRAMKSKCR